MKFNFFRKVKNTVEKVIETVVPHETNMGEVIEAIHNEFDTAADRALNEALFILSQDGIEEIKKEKAQLMQKCGFTSTTQVKEFNDRMKVDDDAKKRAEIINKYKEKYPQYKFIFIEQVKEICKKYGLVCGKSDMYKGDIPYKNLKEIEQFIVSDNDRYYLQDFTDFVWRLSSRRDPMDILGGEESIVNGPLPIGDTGYTYTDIPFFICAPAADMDTRGYKVEDGILKREYPDPIVLHYVKDGFLIVTKWGIEGDDPIVNE